MKKKLILLISLIPFARYVLKVFYIKAIKKMRLISEGSDDILDIYLISNMSNHDFIYGSSDLNLLFVVKDETSPRNFLSETRKELSNLWLTSLLVDIKNLAVLKESELKTPLIRSSMLYRYSRNDVTWSSILGSEPLKFTLKEQDHHNIQYHCLGRVQKMLLNPRRDLLLNRHWIRSFGKNMYFSFIALNRYNLIEGKLDSRWHTLCSRLMRFPIFAQAKYRQLKVLSLKKLDFKRPKLIPHHVDSSAYNDNLIHFCQSLLEFPIVEDVILKPALIQLDSEQMKGKVFVDVLLGQKDHAFNFDNLHHLQNGIDSFLKDLDDTHPRYFFRFSTYGFLKIKCEQVLFDYPLEYFYRVRLGHSMRGFKYKFSPDPRQIDKASIQFILQEFMRFRSLKQENFLIGSKFIKSLNIIYRYQLLLSYTKGQEFAVSHSFKSIMEDLTPQLSQMKPNTIVDEESWVVIKAQMLYLLKRIRDELATKKPSLKNLQF